MKISNNIEVLIDALKILPGVGPKTAKRMALNLLSKNKEGAEQIASSIQNAIETIHSETYSLLIDTYIKDETEKDRLLNSIETIPSIRKNSG